MHAISERSIMPRAKGDNTEQLVVRVSPGLRAKLLDIVPLVGARGVSVTFTDAVRAALERGVEAIKADAAPPSKGRKAGAR
jgi:hypothetical protein